MRARRCVIVAACSIALLLVAAPAFAHVGVDAESARPGAETLWQIHVPNESDSAATTMVELRLPDGFVFVTAGRNRGWDVSADGDVVTIEGGRIEAGADADFRIRVQNAPTRGDYPVPALQTYSDGEVVRWTGEAGSDKPAPVVTLAGKPVAAPPTQPPATAAPTPASEPAATLAPTVVPSAAPTITGGDDPAAPSSGVSAGTVVAVLAVLAVGGGLAALAVRRRPGA
jgi:uncharacterized protein YcnI